MRRRRQPAVEVDVQKEREQELRLVEAERRANVLFQTAEWLHAVVVKRDLENHWQASVNQLFYGGKPT